MNTLSRLRHWWHAQKRASLRWASAHPIKYGLGIAFLCYGSVITCLVNHPLFWGGFGFLFIALMIALWRAVKEEHRLSILLLILILFLIQIP